VKSVLTESRVIKGRMENPEKKDLKAPMGLPDTQDRKVSLELMVSPETTVNEEIKVLMETSESRDRKDLRETPVIMATVDNKDLLVKWEKMVCPEPQEKSVRQKLLIWPRSKMLSTPFWMSSSLVEKILTLN